MQSSNAALSTLVSSLTKQFQAFHAQTKMSSGLSMECIWRLAHPPLIPTLKRLEDIWQLEQVADQFDSIVWSVKAPLDELVALKGAIVQALDLARRQEVDIHVLTQVRQYFTQRSYPMHYANLAKELENALAPLRLAAGDEVGTREPFFREAFEGLCQHLDIAQDDHQASTLTLLAGRKSNKSTTKSEWSPSARILARVTSFSGVTTPAIAVKDSLPLILLHKA